MTDQLAFDYPAPRARLSDPPTSHEAAVIAIDQAATHRQQAYDLLRAAGESGLSDFQLAKRTGVGQTSIGRRRGELRDAGLVVPRMVIGKKPHPITGSLLVQDKRTDDVPSGSPSAVWCLAEFQRADARPAE